MLSQVIGHRGAAAYAPENTLESFQRALDLGCRFVEFDVMLSVDGEAFIFHDDQLRRTTNGHGDVGLVTAAYLKTLDAGSWFSSQFRGAKIPTLQDALIWLDKHDMQANIEIKPYHHTRMEQTTLAVLEGIQNYWPEHKALPLVSSFDYDALLLCYERQPEIPLGILFREWQDKWFGLAQKINCVSIHLSRRIATEARIKAIKQCGYRVYIYTVNHQSLAHKLFQWGVDAVYSDHPDLLGVKE